MGGKVNGECREVLFDENADDIISRRNCAVVAVAKVVEFSSR